MVDKIIGLKVGADDYMTKPFDTGRLVAHDVLPHAAPGTHRNESDGCSTGDLSINAGKQGARGRGGIRLAPKEFDLLWELLDHRGIVLRSPRSAPRASMGIHVRRRRAHRQRRVRQIRRKLGDASPITLGVGRRLQGHVGTHDGIDHLTALP